MSESVGGETDSSAKDRMAHETLEKSEVDVFVALQYKLP